MLFLSSLDDNYLYDAYISTIQKDVDDFEIEHQACSFLVKGLVPP